MAFSSAGGSQVDGENIRIQNISTISDADKDGFGTAYSIKLSVDTQISDEDVGDSASPYLDVNIDGESVREVGLPLGERSYTTTIRLNQSHLQGFSKGQYDVELRLMERDRLGDDQISVVTERVRIEQTVVSVQANQENVTTLSTISLKASDSTCDFRPGDMCINIPFFGSETPPVEWSVINKAGGGKAKILNQSGAAATFYPAENGTYEVTATPVSGEGEGTSVTIQVRDDGNAELVKQYAPVLHFPEETEHYPTTFESFFNNAREGGMLASILCRIDSCTGFSTQDVASSNDDLVLIGEPDSYIGTNPPKTVYSSVNDTRYNGESYTAITYWLFYRNDPKKDGISEYGLAHQGDLETVTVLLNESGAQYVATSQHYGGEIREWSKAPKVDGRLAVYPALGAHSNFLTNTEEYEGDGLLPQTQFLSRNNTDSSFAEGLTSGAELVYTDTTGGDEIWKPRSGADGEYDVVVLTGEEVWSDYSGNIGGSDGGQIPMQRGARWSDPGEWIENSIVPDEEQLGAEIVSMGIEKRGTRVDASVGVRNTGKKPHQFWIIVEAKPQSESWDSDAAATIGVKPVRVGTDWNEDGLVAQEEVQVRGEIPSGDASSWNIRSRLLLYHPSISDREDEMDERRGREIFSVGS